MKWIETRILSSKCSLLNSCKYKQLFVTFILVFIRVMNKLQPYRIYTPMFKMAVMPLVPETKMADIIKLTSLGNLLVKKVMWLVLTTTSATLILSHDFGADYMTRIADIYSCLSRTHSFHFDSQRQHTHLYCNLQRQLTSSISTHRDNTLSYTATYRDNFLFPFWLPETIHSLSYIWFPAVNPTKCILSATIFFLVLPLRLDLLQPWKQPQKFHQTTERNKPPTWEKIRSS